MNKEALFLANRGGVERSLDAFVFQQRVLRFRYSLYELLRQEECAADQCEAVGSASRAVYLGSFAGYVRNRLRKLENLPDSLREKSDTAYEDFYRVVTPLIERKRFASFLRNLLARPLEIAILLDRALFFEDDAPLTGRNIRLIQLFDPALSPRNVGLVIS